MTIQDLPPALRPREKLLARGPAALADAELLALLLRTGVKGTGVLQLAQSLLDTFGGIAGLLAASAEDLGRVKGLGPAKRAEVAAVVEIARRALAQRLREAPVFDSPSRVREYLQLHLNVLGHEVFFVLFLDAQHRDARAGRVRRNVLVAVDAGDFLDEVLLDAEVEAPAGGRHNEVRAVVGDRAVQAPKRLGHEGIGHVVAQQRHPPGPFPLAAGGGDLVAGAFRDDLPLELGERQQDVQHQPPHGIGCVELLRDRDEGDLVLVDADRGLVVRLS